MITSLPRVAIAVRDMDRATAAFRSLFRMPVHELEWAPAELGGRLAIAAPGAGAYLELLAPSDPERPHSQSFLRFLERRGEGLFAIMFHAPDPDREAEALAHRGLDVLPRMPEALGRDIHPRSTCGVLIRIYPDGSDVRVEAELERELGPATARSAGLALRGIRRVVVAVRDLDTALAAYRDRLGLETVLAHPGERADARRAICAPKQGAEIELLQPLGSEGPVARFLDERGEGMYALVLDSADLDSTVRALLARGVPVGPAGGDSRAWQIERRAAFGVLLRIEAGPETREGDPAWT